MGPRGFLAQGPLPLDCPPHISPVAIVLARFYAKYRSLCFYVLRAFLPSLPAPCACADHRIKTPPGGFLSEKISKRLDQTRKRRYTLSGEMPSTWSDSSVSRFVYVPNPAHCPSVRIRVGFVFKCPNPAVCLFGLRFVFLSVFEIGHE